MNAKKKEMEEKLEKIRGKRREAECNTRRSTQI